MNSDLSVHSSIFISAFDTVFSELDQEFFLLFFLKVTIRKILSLCFSGFGLAQKLYLLLYSCTNTISGENLITEIWVKMLLAN